MSQCLRDRADRAFANQPMMGGGPGSESTLPLQSADEAERGRDQALRAQCHASPLATLLWQVRGDHLTLVALNAEAEAMLLDESKRLLGRTESQAFGDFPAIVDGLRRCMATGERVQRELDYPARSSDEPRRLRITFGFVPDDLVFMHMEDLTALRRAEAEARRHHAEVLHMKRLATVSEFAASLAHEIKQPLSVLTTDLQAALWMIDNGADPDRVVTLIERASRAAERAGAVVSHTRQLVANRTQSRKRADLNAIIESAIEAIGPNAERAGVSLRFEAGADLPPIEADVRQLDRVVMNLAQNAIQAMRGFEPRAEAHRLTISTEAEGASLRLRVDDTGPGLGEAQIERIFEPFYTTRGEGMGMGLSICSRIVEAHGGALTCGSNPDGGARFEATLPVAMAGQQSAA